MLGLKLLKGAPDDQLPLAKTTLESRIHTGLVLEKLTINNVDRRHNSHMTYRIELYIIKMYKGNKQRLKYVVLLLMHLVSQIDLMLLTQPNISRIICTVWWGWSLLVYKELFISSGQPNLLLKRIKCKLNLKVMNTKIELHPVTQSITLYIVACVFYKCIKMIGGVACHVIKWWILVVMWYVGIYRLSYWKMPHKENVWSFSKSLTANETSQIVRFMGPTWGPPGSCRAPMGPILAPWTLLSGFEKNMSKHQPSLCNLRDKNS